MLPNDAALSTREWHFRAESAIKGYLRQIKFLFFWFGFVFLLKKGEEESSPRAAFCFPGLLKLWPIEPFTRKKKFTQVLCLNENSLLKCSSLLQRSYLWIIIKMGGGFFLLFFFFFSQNFPSEVFSPKLLGLFPNKWQGF